MKEIKYKTVEGHPIVRDGEFALKETVAYKELKAALRPSRGEIANYLENELVNHRKNDPDNEYLNYAIESLREKQRSYADAD